MQQALCRHGCAVRAVCHRCLNRLEQQQRVERPQLGLQPGAQLLRSRVQA